MLVTESEVTKLTVTGNTLTAEIFLLKPGGEIGIK